MPRCCVFQPFDNGGPYDKRFEDVISPTVIEAGLEPYRVDRDPSAVIPIDTLEQEIKASAVCLADITEDNPNVWYELGYGIASNRPVLMICSALRKSPFPFDIHHRNVIRYSPDSVSDFKRLGAQIKERIAAALKSQNAVADVIAAATSPTKSTAGRRPHEVAALVFIAANRGFEEGSGISAYRIQQDMENALFKPVAASLAVMGLERAGLIEHFTDKDFDGSSFIAYRLTNEGQDWLVNNQDLLELRSQRENDP
jgi:hypothetical protein